MRASDPTVEYERVKALRETDKALLCLIEGQEIWVPKSQIHGDSEVSRVDDDGTLIISEWIAKEKGLI